MKVASHLLLCVALWVLMASLSQAQQYSVRNLPPIGDVDGNIHYEGAVAVNDLHQVVGYSTTTNGVDGFLWSLADGTQDLGDLGSFSYAMAINSTGTMVVGCGLVSGGNDHAFLWTQAGGIQDLGTLGGPTSCAAGVNSSGQVVGTSSTGSAGHAFLWTQAGGMQDLGTLVGGSWTIAMGINDDGYIVGYGDTARRGELRGFLRDPNGHFEVLQVLPSGTESYGYAVNRFGDVSGAADVAVQGGPEMHAILWTRKTGLQDLGLLPSMNMCYGYGINDREEIVGGCTNQALTEEPAFVWTAANGMQDLNTLIPANYRMTLNSANGVNNDGQIAVEATVNKAPNPSEYRRALLLSPK
jgi:probable HAF family extracellular repeat protein